MGLGLSLFAPLLVEAVRSKSSSDLASGKGGNKNEWGGKLGAAAGMVGVGLLDTILSGDKQPVQPPQASLPDVQIAPAQIVPADTSGAAAAMMTKPPMGKPSWMDYMDDLLKGGV